MSEKVLNIAGKLKYQSIAAIVIVLILVKILIRTTNNFILDLAGEVLVVGLIYLLIGIAIQIGSRYKLEPMRTVTLLSLIFAAFLVNLLVLPKILSIASESTAGNTVFSRSIALIYNAISMLFSCAGFFFFRHLSFQKQRRNIKPFFNAMMVFIFLTSVTAFLSKETYKSFYFIHIAFEVNAIILIFLNSLRISWIAFLTKKEKKRLLFLSIALIVIASFCLASLSGDTHTKYTEQFSYSLEQFTLFIAVYAVIYFGVLFFTTLFHLPTADAYERKAKEVSSLQLLSKMINTVLDFKVLADTVTTLAVEVCNADAAWIVLLEDESRAPRAAKNIGYIDAENLYNHCLSTQNNDTSGIQIISLTEFYKNNKTIEKYFYLAVSPLRSHQKLHGYLITCSRNDVAYDEEDRMVLQIFSDNAAVAIDNARLFEQSIEKERLEKELDVAREMQKKILPQTIPEVEGFEIAALFIPAFEVGGDYYDFFDLGKGKFGFIIADVSGKGITAAFVMAGLRGIFESLSRVMQEPSKIFVNANMILKKVLDRKSFVTAIYGGIDLQRKVLTIARAGHHPLLIARGGEIKEYLPRGFGLGINYSDKFEKMLQEEEIQLIEDDLLVLFTDGVTEAKNNKLEDFGVDELKRIILENNNLSPGDVINKVIRAITTFTESAPQHDDITILVMRCNSLKNGEKNGRI